LELHGISLGVKVAVPLIPLYYPDA